MDVISSDDLSDVTDPRYGLLSFKANVYRDSIRTGGSASSKASFKYYLNISAKNPDTGFPDLVVMVKPKWMKSSLLSGNPKAPSGFYESISSFEDIVTPDIRNDLTPIDETPVPLIQYYSSILPPISPE